MEPIQPKRETKQRRWQKQRQAAGLCPVCGKPKSAASTTYCETCKAKETARHRRWYRTKHGLPLDTVSPKSATMRLRWAERKATQAVLVPPLVAGKDL